MRYLAFSIYAIALLFGGNMHVQASQEQVVQLILNITKGSPGTPNSVGFLALAQSSLKKKG